MATHNDRQAPACCEVKRLGREINLENIIILKQSPIVSLHLSAIEYLVEAADVGNPTRLFARSKG